MTPYQQTLDQALDVAKRPSSLYALPPSQWEQFRRLLRADPFLMATWLCGFDKLLPRIHQPLTYVIGGRARHLAWFLTTTKHESIVIDQIRSELDRMGIDVRDPAQLPRLERALTAIDFRMARGFFKTSTSIPAVLCEITDNPNLTYLVVHGVQDMAEAMCIQLGDFIQSRLYRAFFPDRIPQDEKSNITKKYIRLAGRTVPHKEGTLEALGANATGTGDHFDRFYVSDLTTEEQSEIEQQEACRFLNKIPGLSIRGGGASGRVRRIHEGTRYGNDDDAAKLAGNMRFLHISMPAELRSTPPGFATIRDIGMPTAPEICNAEDLAEIVEDHMGDIRLGPVAYFRNYLLIPDIEGASLFPPAVIDANLAGAQWRFAVDAKDAKKRIGVIRQAVDEKRKPKVRPDGDPETVFIPWSAMRLVLGVDPSASETGDEWGVSVLARDSDRFMYQIETWAGHTHDYMMDVVLLLATQYNPALIGVEKAAMSILSVDLMQRDPRFRAIRHKIVPIANANQNKLIKFKMLLSPKLISGDLLLAPGDVHTRTEAKQYRYGPRAIDNRLDSIAIAIETMGDITPSAKTPRQLHVEALRAERRRVTYEDPLLGAATESWIEACA